jgi:hypothetical protein
MMRFIDDRSDCAVISPAAIAASAYSAFAADNIEPHIEYGCLEHFKGMARKVLAGRFSDDGDRDTSHDRRCPSLGNRTWAA